MSGALNSNGKSVEEMANNAVNLTLCEEEGFETSEEGFDAGEKLLSVGIDSDATLKAIGYKDPSYLVDLGHSILKKLAHLGITFSQKDKLRFIGVGEDSDQFLDGHEKVEKGETTVIPAATVGSLRTAVIESLREALGQIEKQPAA